MSASSAGGPGLFLTSCRCRLRTRVKLPHSTPQLVTLGLFGPFLALRSRPEFRTNEPVTRCLDRRAEWSIWNPYGSDRRDPNTLAPNRIKARTLRYTRQGLVRVPESNTKYGGKLRKTGAGPRCLCRQVSVSPQGFPSEKNCCSRAHSGFVPLFTGQLFIVPGGLLWRDSG
jgi:hypothetical protein